MVGVGWGNWESLFSHFFFRRLNISNMKTIFQSHYSKPSPRRKDYRKIDIIKESTFEIPCYFLSPSRDFATLLFLMCRVDPVYFGLITKILRLVVPTIVGRLILSSDFVSREPLYHYNTKT